MADTVESTLALALIDDPPIERSRLPVSVPSQFWLDGLMPLGEAVSSAWLIRLHEVASMG